MLKVKDLREKTIVELEEELKVLLKELLANKLAFCSRNLENTCAMRNAKKTIARIKTIIKEKKLESKELKK